MSAQHIWGNLAVFLVAAREGGASAAARTLNIHHATVSRHIADLERELGVRLFERSTRGMDLTPAGNELYAHAAKIENEVDAIGRHVAGRDSRLEGMVKVSTVDDLSLSLMPDLVREFRAQHPAITVEIKVQTQRANLTRREADIAIRFGKPPEDPGAVRRKIADVKGALYASREYLQNNPLPKTADDLRDHDVVRSGTQLSKIPTELFWDKFAAPERIAMRSDSMLAQQAAVRAGVGIGWIGYFMLETDDNLQPIPITVSTKDIALWMIIHSEIRHVARVRAFADFAWDYFRTVRSRFLEPPQRRG